MLLPCLKSYWPVATLQPTTFVASLPHFTIFPTQLPFENLELLSDLKAARPPVSFNTLFLLPEIAFSLLSKVLYIFPAAQITTSLGKPFFTGGGDPSDHAPPPFTSGLTHPVSPTKL